MTLFRIAAVAAAVVGNLLLLWLMAEILLWAEKQVERIVKAISFRHAKPDIQVVYYEGELLLFYWDGYDVTIWQGRRDHLGEVTWQQWQSLRMSR